ncbi:MAG: hypothetical protein WBE80_17710 [Methylocella sp.]
MRLRERDGAKSAYNAGMRQESIVRFHTEVGVMIDDIATLLTHAAATNVVKLYGRLYTLQIVRLAGFSDLRPFPRVSETDRANFRLDDFFVMFRQIDQRLRDRKSWSIFSS